MNATSHPPEPNDDPREIRKAIERTRDRIADTAEALAYKTDVSARLKDNVADRVDAVRGAIAGATSKLTQGVHDVSQTAKENLDGAASSLDESSAHLKGTLSDFGDATAERIGNSGKATKSAALDAKHLLEKNPLGLAIGSIAAGFLLGLTLPVSDLERDNVGPLGEKVKDQAKLAASEMVAQGKAVVATAVTGALNSARS